MNAPDHYFSVIFRQQSLSGDRGIMMFLSALGKHEATTSVVFVSKTANAVGEKNAPSKTLKGQSKLYGITKLSY